MPDADSGIWNLESRIGSGRTICFIARRDFLDLPGGDTTQWRIYEQTAKEAGFSAVTWFRDEPMPAADVYHAFNIDQPLEIYPRLRRVKRRNKPFVLTTIHHPNAWMNRFRRENPYAGRAAKAVYRSALGNSRACVESLKEISLLYRQAKPAHFRDLWPSWNSRVNWILRHADSVQLVSRRAADYVKEDFGYSCDSDRTIILANWIDKKCAEHIPMPDAIRSMSEPPILVAGRIEARKNALRIARLAEQVSRPLVFVGRPNPNEREYEVEFRNSISGSRFVRWVPGVPPEQMAGFYAHSSFLLNASYVEVSPLVDIEALLYGCPVATTRYALHHEHLPADTPVCDAYKDQDIIRLLDWRPCRLPPYCAVEPAESKKQLLSVYARLSGASRLQ